MKQILFYLLIVLSTGTAIAQTKSKKPDATYAAAHWKTWLLDAPESYRIAPPVITSSKSELSAIRQAMRDVDAKKRIAITYWDAGAPALRWNQIAPTLTSWDNPDLVMRFPSAWMNMAIYDATILAWKAKQQYKRPRPASVDISLNPLIKAPATYSYPCEHSVTAAAAAHVLAYFYPAKRDSLLQLARQASQSRIDAGVQFPTDVEAGWKLGEAVAKAIIDKAKKDGSDAKWTGEVNKDPKKWTGPYALGLHMQLAKPMFLKSADQFRPPAPPDFEKEMQELKTAKKTFKGASLAYYWANTGAELWNDLLSQQLFENRMADDAPTVARMFAILHVSSRESAIATMDAKYAYWGIRPVQYDTTYKPLLQTPPFPGYPSGHALGSSANATVLSYFFPTEAARFQKLAKDCANSRFHAGIHFRTDNEVGTKMGATLAEYVLKTWMNDEANGKKYVSIK